MCRCVECGDYNTVRSIFTFLKVKLFIQPQGGSVAKYLCPNDADLNWFNSCCLDLHI